ncbi:MAG: aspartyl/asparaginyl beta-hydroxylase domain-containing protein, partial [Steroidobacteraceae bacterium]
MADALSDPASLTSAGFQALRGGDAAAAREHFQRAAATGKAGSDTWYGLSLAHRGLGSATAETAALDRALELDPRNIPALIRKGDLYTARSDARAATTFYRAALKIAGSQGPLAPEWRAELDRIAACVADNSRVFEQHLLTDLRASGLGRPGTQRFGRALELLLGRRRIYLQQPQVFYFPELAQLEFHDRADFPWTAALEQDTAAIREELRAILRAGNRFAPYMQPTPDRPAFDNNGLLNDPSWSACHLIRNGEEVAANAALCPVTMNALRRLPL